MSEETPAKRGDAAWREQRDAISQRNADAHRKSEVQRKARSSAVASAERADAEREAKQLRDLNARIEKQQKRASR